MDSNASMDKGDISPLASRRYVAFISYSHQDAAIARWLHSALEGFGSPRISPRARKDAPVASIP